MPSCEIIGSIFAARITYTVTQDVGLNRSVVRITGVEMRALPESWSAISAYVLGYININGSTAAKMELTSTSGTGIFMTKDYSAVTGVKTYDVTVDHEADGSAMVSVYANLGVYNSYHQETGDRIVKTESVALPRIPRVSALTAAGVELGQEMTIQLTRAAEGFSDTVTWSCGSESGIIAEQTAGNELYWIPPVTLAAQAPEDTQVPVVLTVATFLDGTQVGSQDTTVQCYIPESIVPTLAVAVEDGTGCLEKYGGYVQSQSRARVVTSAAGVYGSTIRQITVSCGQLSGTGEDVSFVLGQSGNIAITVTVTDSRGRSASSETSITVLPYRMPQVTIREAFRCDETGLPQADGQWLKVVFDGSVTALTGNGATYRGVCTVHNGEDTRTVLLADYTGQQTVTGGSFLLTAGVDTGYDCQVSVQDDFCTVVSTAALVSVSFALIDLCRDTKAVGIGMRAKNDGKLSIGLDTDMDEHSIGNLADPEEAQDAATKAYVDNSAMIARVENLLDNSDFTSFIAQAGIGGKHGTQDYAGDRWILDSGTVTGDRCGMYCSFRNVCLNGTIRQILADAPDDVTIGVEMVSGTAEISYLDGAVTITSNGGIIAHAWCYPGNYDGNHLPLYRAKGYEAELGVCKHYYQSNLAACTVGTTFATENGVITITLPRMRVFPTIEIKEIWSQGWGNVTIDQLTPGWTAAGGSMLAQNYELPGDHAGKTILVFFAASADL